jgi:hypothetical protein
MNLSYNLDLRTRLPSIIRLGTVQDLDSGTKFRTPDDWFGKCLFSDNTRAMGSEHAHYCPDTSRIIPVKLSTASTGQSLMIAASKPVDRNALFLSHSYLQLGEAIVTDDGIIINPPRCDGTRDLDQIVASMNEISDGLRVLPGAQTTFVSRKSFNAGSIPCGEVVTQNFARGLETGNERARVLEWIPDVKGITRFDVRALPYVEDKQKVVGCISLGFNGEYNKLQLGFFPDNHSSGYAYAVVNEEVEIE